MLNIDATKQTMNVNTSKLSSQHVLQKTWVAQMC